VPTFLFFFAKSYPEVPTFLFSFVEKRTGGVESFKKNAKIECNIKYNRIFVTTNLVSALSGGTSAPPCPVWNVGG
jgi:hypothetical protein